MIHMRVLLLCLLLFQPAIARTRWMKFTATAYSVQGETASGKQTREGRTVAADPAVIPLGSRIQVRGAGPYSGTYMVQDTGRKVGGRSIDFFIADPAEAKRFGKKPVMVRIIAKPTSAQ
jgi:3D (Asp-Asp-Asp) domain-containing protein